MRVRSFDCVLDLVSVDFVLLSVLTWGSMARRATCYRYWVLIVLSLVTFTNYLDRATVSVAVDEIKAEFNMNDIQMGFLLSQFVWGIVIVIPLIAYLLQRFGARSVGGYGVLGFSLMTLFTPFSTGFYSFAFFRLGLGAFEAPTFPVNSFLQENGFRGAIAQSC